MTIRPEPTRAIGTPETQKVISVTVVQETSFGDPSANGTQPFPGAARPTHP